MLFSPMLTLDINECLEGNGGCRCDPNLTDLSDCSAHCTNVPGSFLCICSEGHYLDADNRTCKGSYCKTSEKGHSKRGQTSSSKINTLHTKQPFNFCT